MKNKAALHPESYENAVSRFNGRWSRGTKSLTQKQSRHLLCEAFYNSFLNKYFSALLLAKNDTVFIHLLSGHVISHSPDSVHLED